MVHAQEGFERIMKKIRVLFVCLGNICRSPTAEAIMNSMVKKADLHSVISVDSAATSPHHEGDESDPRSITHAKGRGHDITSISRPFGPKDFEKFDYILAMDDTNYKDLLAFDRSKKFSKKVFKITQFCTAQNHKEVPDPYYGGPDGFELVIDILEDACHGLLNKIKTDHKL